MRNICHMLSTWPIVRAEKILTVILISHEGVFEVIIRNGKALA